MDHLVRDKMIPQTKHTIRFYMIFLRTLEIILWVNNLMLCLDARVLQWIRKN